MNDEIEIHASEGQHWYQPDGTPVYEVPAKDGHMRPATLRDARKLGLYPGVSSILDQIVKPGLQAWRETQVLMAALTLPRKPVVRGADCAHCDGTGASPIKGQRCDWCDGAGFECIREPEAEWLALVKQDAQAQSRAAADRGTEIHAEIERYFGGGYDASEMVSAVLDALRFTFGSDFPIDDGYPERTFAHPLGFGGKSDVVFIAEEQLVCDFKTKDAWELGAKLHYPEMAMQLAAYREGLGFPDARCANVFITRDAPFAVQIHEWPQAELDVAWRKFQALLTYWKCDKGYDPADTPAL